MKNNHRKAPANQAGFTLVEVMISTVILAIFVLAASSALKDIYTFTNKSRDQLEVETDLSFAMRYMGDLLKNAGPSFNNIKNNIDDSGSEFFDHIHDVSTAGWNPNLAKRTLTLSKASGHFDLVFLTYSPDQVDQIYYNPVDAYIPPEPTEDMDTSSVLKYAAFNQNSVISKFAPKVWIDGNILLLKVPIPLRYVAADATVNMMSAPREHIFLGKVKSADLEHETFAGYVRSTHPIDNTPVLSVDTFLRKVPTVGGASPIIEATLVKGWKISLIKNPQTTFYDLYSYEYLNGQFVKPFLIAAKVKSLELNRESVGLQVISVQLTIESDKK
jgi:prepilin-type N-terminal cleavage/methylation domain-containing protein